jgi:hypothetical protein
MRKNPIKKKFLDGVPTPKHLMGGYIGEKEIKSAGNKIYKIINTPEAQNLGKAALMTLITGAIGSTIHSGLSSTPEVSPPAGAPPVRVPDELDTNPMLHWAGLGLKKDVKKLKEDYQQKIHPAIKSASEAIHDFITSQEARDMTKTKLKNRIIKHLEGSGIISKAKKVLKDTGTAIYNVITSKSAQNLGKAALVGLITLAIKKGVDSINEENARGEQLEDYENRYRNTISEYGKSQSNSLLSGSTDFGAGHLDKLSKRISDSIEFLKKKKFDKRYLLFLITSLLGLGVYHSRTKTEPHPYETANVEERPANWKEILGGTFYTKHIKPTATKIYEAITSEETKDTIKKLIVSLLTLAIANEARTGFPVSKHLLDVGKKNATRLYDTAVSHLTTPTEQTLRNRALANAYHEARARRATTRAGSIRLEGIKSHLNKLYGNITSEKGKKISKQVLLTIAGLLLAGVGGAELYRRLKPLNIVEVEANLIPPYPSAEIDTESPEIAVPLDMGEITSANIRYGLNRQPRVPVANRPPTGELHRDPPDNWDWYQAIRHLDITPRY